MKYLKRIFTAVVFFAGLYVLLLIASQFFIPKNNTDDYGMEDYKANGFLAENENSLDILFLGDSESHHSIIPMQIWNDTGITSYNCSSDRQVLSYTYSLLKRACSRQNPKIVFLETDAVFRRQTTKGIIYDELSERLPIFRYHDRWKDMCRKDLTFTQNPTWRHFDKGYVYTKTNRPVPAEKINNYIIPTDQKDVIPWVNVQYVKAIKSYCDSIGAKFVMISTPSTDNWNYMQHNSLMELANDIGVDFIDLNLKVDELKIDWSVDSVDAGNHLNYMGAVKVTTYLTKYITDTGLCESHKGDPEYSLWDEDYKQHVHEVETMM